jgi:glycosyltransferase involved in cell wall biosynthesis
MPHSFTAIIPAFNEAARIGRVLRVLARLRSLAQIIVVDDGSTDGTAALVRRRFPRAELILLPANRGKAAAVAAGVRAANSDYVFLIDADLQNPRLGEFDAALRAVAADPGIDMLVLRRVSKDWVTRTLRGDVLISGERIVRRADLLAFFRRWRVRGFQLEVALNQHMLEAGKKVRWLPISSVGVISLKKLGFWGGVQKELRMFAGIFGYLGVRRLLWQFLAFGRQRA